MKEKYENLNEGIVKIKYGQLVEELFRAETITLDKHTDIEARLLERKRTEVEEFEDMYPEVLL